MVPDSADLTPLLQEPASTLGYRQGTVLEWNLATGANRISVGGGTLDNLPVITDSHSVGIQAGDSVAIIKFNDSYAVLGSNKKGVIANAPWEPVPLYQAFDRNAVAGTTSVNVGALVAWEGTTFVTNHSHIEIVGTFGQLTGANNTSYRLVAGNDVIGTWTHNGTLATARRGPYSIAEYRNFEFLLIRLEITASTGSGTVAFHPLGCFLRTVV
jgi:hypothetical protein